MTFRSFSYEDCPISTTDGTDMENWYRHGQSSQRFSFGTNKKNDDERQEFKPVTSGFLNATHQLHSEP